MKYRATILFLVAWLLIAVAAGCAGPTEAVTEPSATTEATAAAVQPEVAGTYRLRAPDGETQFDLTLAGDGTLRIDRVSEPAGPVAAGNWVYVGDGVVLTLSEVNGAPAATPEQVKIEMVDGFPTATELGAGNVLYDLDEAAYTIGSGEQHALVGEVHRRLAAIDYLNFTDPGDDLYTEETRQAVVRFQETQGLLPNGVVDAATWLLLGNPRPPQAAAPAAPAPTAPAEPITGVPDLSLLPSETEDGRPIAYFTFDDGPYPPYTEEIVAAFEPYGGQATFFELGANVRTWPESVRTAAAAGHYIGNHTNSHTSLDGVSYEQFIAEVDSTRDAILDAAGDLFTLDKNVRYLRPPYGAMDANSLQYATQSGYAVVLWDIDPQDWRQPGVDIIAQHVLTSVFPGAIILMHDGGGDRTQSVAALQQILPELDRQGYVFRNLFLP